MPDAQRRDNAVFHVRRADALAALPDPKRLSIPTVSLAIVPMMTERAAVASAGFWIFDESLVALETPTASIEVTRPQEIELYARMFGHLKAPAVYGGAARALMGERITSSQSPTTCFPNRP